MMEAQIFNHKTGEARTMPQLQATQQTRMDRDWSFDPPAPKGWERETPLYRASQALRPAVRARYRMELPFSETGDSWQYGTEPIKKGQIVATREWCHPSMQPLNYSAKQVHEFFTTRPRSRLPRSPWVGDRIRLEDGMGSAAA
ncbi:hypothetical protein [Bradyrhizobium diazoefficiens]|uniref:hypothetical protein n=1 Tax=Bradyrhizobium diazoefficiens TaxID=1355477 RepID=UPI003496A608